MIVKLLIEHHLEFLSFKGGCIGSSESTLVKMPHCWKSHVATLKKNFFDRNLQSQYANFSYRLTVLIHCNVQHPIFQEISKGNYMTPDQLTMEK